VAKSNSRLEAARKAYREALDAARAKPSAEAWARLLAAGKELSSQTEPRAKARARRTRRGSPQEPPTLEQSELDGTE
jgi:hypothetical protein